MVPLGFRILVIGSRVLLLGFRILVLGFRILSVLLPVCRDSLAVASWQYFIVTFCLLSPYILLVF